MPFPRARKKPEPLNESGLYEYAVGALSRRMRTVAELARLMRRRAEPGEAGQTNIDAVLARLKDHGYVNDTNYATSYARLRQENASFGKRRVRQDLAAKGVKAEVIAATLDAAYENVNEEALARRHLARKGVKKPTNDKESARIVRTLIRAGFSTGIIFKILKNWNASDQALAEVESIEDNPSD